MIELIVFIVLISGISWYITRPKNVEYEDDTNTTVVEEEIVKKNCSSCSGGRTKNKFEMRPMGQEYDRNTLLRTKIMSPNGELSTVTTRPDITNMQSRPWQDFYPTSGKSIFAPGTSATWGLSNSFENAPVRACNVAQVPVYTPPCANKGLMHRFAQLLYTGKGA